MNKILSTLRIFSLLLTLAISAQAVTIDLVPVGNLGNAADTAAHSGNPAGQGAVSYDYNIGKYEVTASQYTAFLNAVAGVDTYSLYNTYMANTSYGSGISQSGGGTSHNPYTYTVDANFVNRPVNYVSFWDALRFANWLNNDQKTTAQMPNVTEVGAYTLTTDGINNNTIVRNADWKWAVASEDEWYKAAYYNAAASSYYTYPTSNNNPPGRDLADVSGNNANYYGDPYPIQSPYYTTIAGQFQNSPSPYGTFDQGGNVFEWNESIIQGWRRGVRGGAFYFDSNSLASSDRYTGLNYNDPASGLDFVGFRVVSVPEPSSIAFLSITLTLLMWWRHRSLFIYVFMFMGSERT